jgi:hypothetical protein
MTLRLNYTRRFHPGLRGLVVSTLADTPTRYRVIEFWR